MEPADQGLLEALQALAAALRQIKAPGMIIGGLAVIARGVPRLTVDADATVWGEQVDLEDLVQILGQHQIVPRIQDALEFARKRQVLLLRHAPSGTPIEVSLAWLPFEEEALKKATLIQFAGFEIPVATAEDLVIYKVLAWRDQDRSDVERLLVLHGKTMDLERIRSFVGQFAEFSKIRSEFRISTKSSRGPWDLTGARGSWGRCRTWPRRIFATRPGAQGLPGGGGPSTGGRPREAGAGG